MDISDKGTVFMYNSNNESRGKQGVPETMATGSERHKMPRLLTDLIVKAGADGHSMQHLAQVLDVSYVRLNQWMRGESHICNAQRSVHDRAARYIAIPFGLF